MRNQFKNNHDYYCINCLHSFKTEGKLKSHERNLYYCHVKIPEAHNKKLNYNQDQKSIKIPFIVYADTESLPEKIHTCDNDP